MNERKSSPSGGGSSSYRVVRPATIVHQDLAFQEHAECYCGKMDTQNTCLLACAYSPRRTGTGPRASPPAVITAPGTGVKTAFLGTASRRQLTSLITILCPASENKDPLCFPHLDFFFFYKSVLVKSQHQDSQFLDSFATKFQ